ncbi:MAG: hypothetical protein M1829_005774 [Trizodia sp. TS-e1964]|nr:MAG: hypothetical protein M1829_005774 [Trizodia sp. TS-e1964]
MSSTLVEARYNAHVISNAPPATSQPKKHAACDECRLKKLKCSGEASGCFRCLQDQTTCFFSNQKQMGRPRKPRTAESTGETARSGGALPTMINGTMENSRLSKGLNLTSDAQLSIPGHSAPVEAPIKKPPLGSAQLFGDPGMMPDISFDLPPDFPRLPQPTSLTHSSVLEAVPDQPLELEEHPPPMCSCMANMSNAMHQLETLPPAPYPVQLPTLRFAHRSGMAALLCTICPLEFATLFANASLLVSLLPLIASIYGTILASIDMEATIARYHGTPKKVCVSIPENCHQYVVPEITSNNTWKEIELDADEWRKVARDVIYADIYGIGRPGDPNGGGLLTLVQGLEARQLEAYKLLDIETRITPYCAIRETKAAEAKKFYESVVGATKTFISSLALR